MSLFSSGFIYVSDVKTISTQYYIREAWVKELQTAFSLIWPIKHYVLQLPEVLTMKWAVSFVISNIIKYSKILKSTMKKGASSRYKNEV